MVTGITNNNLKKNFFVTRYTLKIYIFTSIRKQYVLVKGEEIVEAREDLHILQVEGFILSFIEQDC